MSRYSARDPETGKHETIVIRRNRPAAVAAGLRIHDVYLGDRRIGELHGRRAPGSQHATDWAAISNAREPKGLRLVDGLRTRWDGVRYLLRAAGVWE